MADGLRDRTGLLCAQLSRWESLDPLIRDAGGGPALDELKTVLVAGGVADERLSRLVDDIEDVCARRGLVGVAGRDHDYRPLPPGVSAPRPATAWVCPYDRCDRVVLPEESAAAPVCAASGGTPLRWFTVPR